MKRMILFLMLAGSIQAATIPARSISVDTNTVAFSSDRLQPVLDWMGTRVFAWINPTNGITQAAGDLRWLGISAFDGTTITTNASGQLVCVITNGAVTFLKLGCVTSNFSAGSTSEVSSVAMAKTYIDSGDAAVVDLTQGLTQGFISLFAETNYFMAVHSVTSGTAIAKFPANVWTQRIFNVVYTNTMPNHVSLSSNNFIVAPGTYYVRASSPTAGDGSAALHQICLYNRTTGTVVLPGTLEYAGAASPNSTLCGRFTIASTNTLAIDHLNTGANSMGHPSTTGWSNKTNVLGGVTNVYFNINIVYSRFELWKIK